MREATQEMLWLQLHPVSFHFLAPGSGSVQLVFASLAPFLCSQPLLTFINNTCLFIDMFFRAGGREEKEKQIRAPHIQTSGGDKINSRSRSGTGANTNVCFCAVFRSSFLTVAEGAHRQKVKALITWIKAAGTAPPPLPHPPPPLFFF